MMYWGSDKFYLLDTVSWTFHRRSKVRNTLRFRCEGALSWPYHAGRKCNDCLGLS